jgi:hypothetical protein
MKILTWQEIGRLLLSLLLGRAKERDDENQQQQQTIADISKDNYNANPCSKASYDGHH